LGELGGEKSTLVNGIIGRNAVDCKRAETGRSATGVTQTMKKYVVKSACGDTILSVFDTPSLCDPVGDKKDIFRDIAKSTKGDIHLLVYCCDMRSRVNEIGYLVKFSIQIVLPKLIRARM